MKNIIYILIILLAFVLTALILDKEESTVIDIPERRWKVTSIDTVKYSRDLAREKANNEDFLNTIDKQVKLIADAGASHISIGTPYDEEFIPFLEKWVRSARKYKLKVWFRGNFSGWEEWFGYNSITREEHKQLLAKFIESNGDLFENGDIFTSCPECENGGPGDPRHNNDIEGHRQFLIDEYQVLRTEFRLVDKNVISNYFPMNGDVAKLVMDRETTKNLGGIVTVDHYVEDPETLNSDLANLAASSGGKIVLGEFGAPIPDIHGKMTQSEQADWLEKLLSLLVNNTNVIGISYWTNTGGSTQIWKGDGTPSQSVTVLNKYFNL